MASVAPRWLVFATLLLAACPPAPATPPAVSGNPLDRYEFSSEAISSPEQLDQYRKSVPSARSPLGLLSSGARRRFLASLTFGSHGLGGFAAGDLEFELTRDEAYAVLRLFGAQDDALDLDTRLTPRNRLLDRQASVLEPIYAQLEQQRDGSDAQASRREGVRRLMTRLARYRDPAALHALGDRDVEFLFRADALALAVTAGAEDLQDLRADFNELSERHRVDRPHLATLNDALVRAGRTMEANALLRTHPMLQRRQAPSLVADPRLRAAGRASVWSAITGLRSLIQQPFDLDAPAQVLVLGSARCHFSQKAARDIDADSALQRLFQAHARWVAPHSDITAFDAVQLWNRSHPTQPLAIAHANAEFPMFTHIETPTFYFMRRGRVVATVVGWPAAGNRAALMDAFGKLGLSAALAPASAAASSSHRRSGRPRQEHADATQ